jgi:hypothetical protein
VHEHATDGWRLVQIFGAGRGRVRRREVDELIFERERIEPAASDQSACAA